jgi:hypothetical protein
VAKSGLLELCWMILLSSTVRHIVECGFVHQRFHRRPALQPVQQRQLQALPERLVLQLAQRVWPALRVLQAQLAPQWKCLNSQHRSSERHIEIRCAAKQKFAKFL